MWSKDLFGQITIILKRMKTCILNCGYVLYVKGVSVLCGGLYIVGYIFSLGNNQKYQQLSSDTKSVQVVKIETIFVPSDWCLIRERVKKDSGKCENVCVHMFEFGCVCVCMLGSGISPALARQGHHNILGWGSWDYAITFLLSCAPLSGSSHSGSFYVITFNVK